MYTKRRLEQRKSTFAYFACSAHFSLGNLPWKLLSDLRSSSTSVRDAFSLSGLSCRCINTIPALLLSNHFPFCCCDPHLCPYFTTSFVVSYFSCQQPLLPVITWRFLFTFFLFIAKYKVIIEVYETYTYELTQNYKGHFHCSRILPVPTLPLHNPNNYFLAFLYDLCSYVSLFKTLYE